MSRMTALRCKLCMKPILKDQLVLYDGQPQHRECMLEARRAQKAPPPAVAQSTPTPAVRVKSQELRTDAVRQPAHRVVADNGAGFNVETAAGQRITAESVPLATAQSIAEKAGKPKSKDKPKPTGRK